MPDAYLLGPVVTDDMEKKASLIRDGNETVQDPCQILACDSASGPSLFIRETEGHANIAVDIAKEPNRGDMKPKMPSGRHEVGGYFARTKKTHDLSMGANQMASLLKPTSVAWGGILSPGDKLGLHIDITRRLNTDRYYLYVDKTTGGIFSMW